MRILIVEDSTAIATNLYDYLESLGHRVDAACDGKIAFNLATSTNFDVILLDLGLPRMDGITLCLKLRSECANQTPILILTARNTLEDKLTGFATGADDYLVKPFALEEVAARLNALHTRNVGRLSDTKIVAGDIHYDPMTMKASLGNTVLELTPKCLRLLEVFLRSPNQLLTRKTLEIEIWGEEQETSERLRHHLHLLRRQLQLAGGESIIKNEHGLGYRLDLNS